MSAKLDSLKARSALEFLLPKTETSLGEVTSWWFKVLVALVLPEQWDKCEVESESITCGCGEGHARRGFLGIAERELLFLERFLL